MSTAALTLFSPAGRLQALLGREQLVSDIQRCEHGDTQRVNGRAMGRDPTHIGMNQRRKLRDVRRILATKMVGMVVDGDGDKITACVLPAHRSSRRLSGAVALLGAKLVQLVEQAFYASPNLVALTHKHTGFFFGTL